VAVISAPGGDGLAPHAGLAQPGGAHVLALAQGTASYHISFILPEAEVDAVVTASTATWAWPRSSPASDITGSVARGPRSPQGAGRIV
jgi:hypothetical protein